PVLEPTALLFSVERRQCRELRELRGQRLDPRRVEAEPVERARVEACCSLHVGGVRGGDRRSPLADEPGGALEGGGDRVVGQQRDGGRRAGRLAFELVAEAHATRAAVVTPAGGGRGAVRPSLLRPRGLRTPRRSG